jgi:Rieske Fe-S protein
MDRKEFLSNFSLGLAAVCAGGCLASCSKGDAGSPGGGTGPTPPAGTSFTVDLATEIKDVGASITKKEVIVVRLAEGNDVSSFTAVQVACTHQGTAIDYDASKGNFVCPNHGSQFTTTGAVINGPATASLKKYKIAISGDTMTITS